MDFNIELANIHNVVNQDILMIFLKKKKNPIYNCMKKHGSTFHVILFDHYHNTIEEKEWPHFSSSHNLQEILIMQLPVDHVICGISQIFHSGECVQNELSQCCGTQNFSTYAWLMDIFQPCMTLGKWCFKHEMINGSAHLI